MCYIVQRCPNLNRERNRILLLIRRILSIKFKQSNSSVFFHQQYSFIGDQHKFSFANFYQSYFLGIQIKEFNFIILKEVELFAKKSKVIRIGFKLIDFLSNIIINNNT